MESLHSHTRTLADQDEDHMTMKPRMESLTFDNVHFTVNWRGSMCLTTNLMFKDLAVAESMALPMSLINLQDAVYTLWRFVNTRPDPKLALDLITTHARLREHPSNPVTWVFLSTCWDWVERSIQQLCPTMNYMRPYITPVVGSVIPWRNPRETCAEDSRTEIGVSALLKLSQYTVPE